jgi:uncharacterized membrane protein YhaH (DUF805 family)
MDKFLGFQGRIGRGRWWLGILTLIIATLVLYFALAYAFGLPLTLSFDTEKDAAMFAGAGRTASVIGLVVMIALIYPSLSLSAQRLNDRNRPTGLVWLTLLPTVLGMITGFLGLSVAVVDVGGVAMLQPTLTGWIVNGIALVIGLWILIDLGILRGTKGPNRNGPDPLER